MATTSKSPRAVLTAAHAVAAAAIPAYAHRFSPKVFTQHQVFACLVLKASLKTDYRGVAALLADCPDLREAIGMRRMPHFTALQKAAARLLAAEATTPLHDATVARAMGRRRRVGTAAADATGFESRHVSPYFLRRSGREGKRTRRYTRFPKLDIVCDCASHLILTASVGQGPRPDVAGFAKLAREHRAGCGSPAWWPTPGTTASRTTSWPGTSWASARRSRRRGAGLRRARRPGSIAG